MPQSSKDSNTIRAVWQNELHSVTLGGFLTEQLQHVPAKGEIVTFAGYTFQVQKASHKRVRQVLISKIEQTNS